PIARSSARAKVVLPAPSSPRRYTTPPSSSAGARPRAKAIVAASLGSAIARVRAASGTAIHQRTQIREKIGSQQAAFAHTRREVARARMQADAEASRIPRVESLREQARDHAGEHVAHSARSHARIAPGTRRRASIGIGNQTARAL